MVKSININIDTNTNSLGFLDNEIVTPVIESFPDKNNKNLLETVLGFIDKLFTNIVMKYYFKNIKMNK
jgi:hypothetical protein